MSPQTLADETVELAAVVEPERSSRPRPRLTVREMQIALDAARSVASPGPARPQVPSGGVPPGERTERGGMDRSHAAPCHDALEGNSAVTAAIAAPPLAVTAAPDTPAVDRQAEHEPWLPEHDGPVSLTGIAAPRTRAVRRAAARPDRAARRPATKSRPAKAATMAPALAAAAAAAPPPRIIVVPACGGAGATTTAVLLAAGLAPACGAVLLAGGPDRGTLAIRSNAEGGDPAALTEWARQHPRRPLRIDTPGLAIGTSGQDDLVVAASGRRPGQDPLTADTALALLSSAAATRAAVVLDWGRPPDPVPDSVWAAATSVVVVAPATSPGLRDAEYTVEQIQVARPERASLSLLTVDVRGRAPRRCGRAALARLRALRLPVAALPHDAALADHPGVRWPSLRPRTRAAVLAALTQLLHREDLQ